nr:hypothetical protein [Tanacetum cinerariifolium]
IDYDEGFPLVAGIEAIRLFLSYASLMGFNVYQMHVKNAFLYGTIEEEFVPRAWYKTLSTYLLKNRFRRGIIDNTLFIKKDKGDILLVQVYVDDIIFRIEAIGLFLSYASFMGFIVYQMDVKSAFMYGKIEEEVYVCQPPSFEDLHFPNKVYKVEKALYGLHQASKAWYETLSTCLLENRFRRGIMDKTLIIRKDKGNLLLMQVYVDDIIFGSTKKSLCKVFERLMHKKFQMSFIGELAFFLGLQVMHRDDGIFISQDKSIIGSLKYLTASRLDIMFAVCACPRFQVTPKVSHLHAMKRIFRYLNGQPKLGIWYPRDSPIDLEAFLDSDYDRASLDKKFKIRGC